LATSATQFSNVGDYSITVTLVHPNYSVSAPTALCTSFPSRQTIFANFKTKTYGDVNPTLTPVLPRRQWRTLSYTLSTSAGQFSSIAPTRSS